MFESKNALERAFDQVALNADKAWLSTARRRSRQSLISGDFSALDISLAMARRKMSASGSERDMTGQYGSPAVAEMARILLVLDAQEALPGTDIIRRAYVQGDEYEREAILKGLILLDMEGKHKDLAVEACRTNVVTMMNAVSINNPYPARWFTEHEFNQMVLKCLFIGLDIGYVDSLLKRRNPAMSRMCYDYLRERLAADRDLPYSIWLAISVEHIPEAKKVFEQYLAGPDKIHQSTIRRSLNNL